MSGPVGFLASTGAVTNISRLLDHTKSKLVSKKVTVAARVIHGPVAIFALSGVAQDRHAAEQNLIGSAKRSPNTSARRTTFLAISFGKISRRRHCTPIPAARLPRNGILTNLAKQ